MAVTPTTLRAQLLRDEGVRLYPYTDTVGKLTIGCGRNLTDTGLSLQEVDVLLDNDLARFTAAVLARVAFAVRLDEVRRAALTNLAFNLGIEGLLGFRKMLAALEAGDSERAARELLDSKYAGQVGPRAERLAEQLRTGAWQ